MYEYAQDNIGTELEILYYNTYFNGKLLFIDNVRAIIQREVKHSIYPDSVIVKEVVDGQA